MDQIQEDDLMNLETFTQYGLLASGRATAYQKILFLIRDWIHPKENAYGPQGGQRYLDDILEVKPDQEKTHQDLRLNLKKCFSDIDCYLMPEPGYAAVRSEGYDGRPSELSAEFVEHLKKLVPLLLAPENIEKKTLAGQTIKAKDLFNNFKIYMEAFNSEDLPAPKSVAESIEEARCAKAANTALHLYREGMQNYIDENGILSEECLNDLHSSLYKRALEHFRSYGISERISSSYEQQLIQELGKSWKIFVEEMKQRVKREETKKNWFVAAAGIAAAVAVRVAQGAAMASFLPTNPVSAAATAVVAGLSMSGVSSFVYRWVTSRKN